MASEEPQKRKVAFEEEDPEEDEFDEEEEDEEEDEEEEEEDDDEMVDLLANTLMTPEGDTLCGTLVKISNTLETQNRILVKLLSTLSGKKA